MIDNETRKAVRVNVRPLTIETIIRSNRRDRPLLVGWLIESLVAAAQSIRPGFMPDERPDPRQEITPALAQGWAVPAPEPQGRLSRWIRRLPSGDEAGDSDHGQGLAEYALILALIAIIAVIALLFLGAQVSETLSRVGNSITPP